MLISGEKMLMSLELKGCVTWFIFFFRLGITVPSFIIAGYVWQILGRGSLFATPHPWRPILSRVKEQISEGPNEQSRNDYWKQDNLCVALVCRAKQQYLSSLDLSLIDDNKNFGKQSNHSFQTRFLIKM